MTKHWLKLHDLPAEGREFSFSDREFWEGCWREYHLPLRAGRPLEADFTVIPQKDGCLVRGRLSGSVVLPCDRCTADTEHDIAAAFDIYAQPGQDETSEREPLVRGEGDEMELDAGSLLWQEFSLEIPVKALCSESCRGICPTCGRNLNEEPCDCSRDETDPRLAALRDLRIKPS